jgi:hypothetical protein
MQDEINKQFGNRIVFTFEEEEESSDEEVEEGSSEWFDNYEKSINSYMEFLQKEDDDDSESIIKEFELDEEYKKITSTLKD